MKLDKDENDISNYPIKKINNRVTGTMEELERFNSVNNQRPFTSFKTKKREFDKRQSFTGKNNCIPKQNRALFASKYCNRNLYLDKDILNLRRSKTRNHLNNNDYYGQGQEELADKLIKLKKVLNQLNSQNSEQKVILYKQKKELKKQNQILNKVKEKYFFENIYRNYDDELNSKHYDLSIGPKDNNNENKISSILKKQKSMEEIKSLPNQEKNNNIQNKPEYINFKGNSYLKELYDKLVFQNERKDKEIQALKEKIEQIKLSNETNLSNLKMQYNKLKNELNKKNEELTKIKKFSKCTKYNEIMKEKEIFQNEMINIKNKFTQVLEIQEIHKSCVKKIKFLVDELNNKDSKIELLENKFQLSFKNWQEYLENLEKELTKKNARIQKLENIIKKLNIKVNSSNNALLKEKREISDYGLLKLSKQCHLLIKPKSNQKEVKVESNDLEKNNKDIDKNNMDFNLNIQDEITDKKENQNDIDIISNENEKEDTNLKEEKIEINEIQNKDNNSENINKISAQNNLIEKEKENDIMNSNNELLLIYLELNKRKIDIDSFINEVFSKLIKENSIIDNKKMYLDYLIQYFKISDDEGKKIIEDLSNKQFTKDKTIENIKANHKEKFNEFENEQKKEKEKENELNQKLREIDENKFKNIILKYDDIQSGLLYFNQMLSLIKELDLEKFMFQILLLTKETEVFNLFNYQNLFSTTSEIEEKSDKNETNDEKPEQKGDKKVENIEQEKEGKVEQNLEQEKEDKKEENLEQEKEDKKIENSEQEKENKMEENLQKEKEDKIEENKEKNNKSSSSRKYEEEFDANINEKNFISNDYESIENESHMDKIDDISDKILKQFAHFIVIEGSTPNLYLSPFKEEITEENKTIEVINPEKLFNFMQEKKIEISDKEKEEIINKYCLENVGENNLRYIDLDKLAGRLFELMKKDDNINNDEDFMKNIQNLEIEGFD